MLNFYYFAFQAILFSVDRKEHSVCDHRGNDVP